MKVIDFEEFVRDVKNIYSDGNMMEAHKMMIHHINNLADDQGNDLTYSFIMEKWDRSIKLWNMKHGDKPSQFLGKDALAEKKNIFDFLNEKLYNNEYSLEKGEQKRDEYLFPAWIKISQLADLFKKISKTIVQRKEDVVSGKTINQTNT